MYISMSVYDIYNIYCYLSIDIYRCVFLCTNMYKYQLGKFLSPHSITSSVLQMVPRLVVLLLQHQQILL